MKSTLVRGFATLKTQVADLRQFGLSEKDIYLSTRGAESLEACLDSFRGRPGRLIVARDLRIFGETKQAVAAVMARLEKTNIRVTDISHPEDTTVAEMVQRAQVKISGARFADRRKAKSFGRKGGLGKGVGAAVTRVAQQFRHLKIKASTVYARTNALMRAAKK